MQKMADVESNSVADVSHGEHEHDYDHDHDHDHDPELEHHEREQDQDHDHDHDHDQEDDHDPESSAQNPNNTATPGSTTRRQTNGTIGSVYSGNKIRHLKKEDGIPLWRKDIQYEFLKLVFEDKTPVFTRYSDGARNVVFSDIYIDAMARSSKTSKVLKDKLQNDRQAAVNMAMICLLVNVGRMNTTLNCAFHFSFFAGDIYN